MDKLTFIMFYVVSAGSWRYHPGYLRDPGMRPTLGALVRDAEELWDIIQRL